MANINIVDLLKMKVKATKEETEKAQAKVEELQNKLSSESDKRGEAESEANASR